MTKTTADLERIRGQVEELVRAGDVRQLRALRDQLRTRLARGQKTQLAVRYLYDPVAWSRDCIDWPDGQGLTSYQDDTLRELPVRRRVAVRGPHGLGKTAVASIVVLWFATTREAAGIDWKVLTTASAWRHLAVYLWPEIHKWARRIRWDVLGFPPFNERTELLAYNLKLQLGAASAVASNKAELIEGAHADSLLYLIDEAKIVPDATWDAIEGAFSGGRTEGLPESFALAISTPGPPAGRFYDIHSRKPGLEDWHVRHVTLQEAIDAGRISTEWAEQRKRQWGADSALYFNRVLGEFHASDEDAVIPLAWVEAAIERWHAWHALPEDERPALTGRQVVGVDVARTGADSTAFAHRHGPAVLRLVRHDQKDTMQVTALVQATRGRGRGARPVPVVDSVGVGGGVVDRLRELRVPVLPFTGSAGTRARTRDGEFGFKNVRSGAYWQLRELLDPAFDSEIMLPPDDLMISDLTAPTWKITTGVPPKIQIENKDDVIARLGRSPDAGDAVVMAFWAERLSTSAIGNPADPSRKRSTAAARYARPTVAGRPSPASAPTSSRRA